MACGSRAHLCASPRMLLVARLCCWRMVLSLEMFGMLPAIDGQAPSPLACPCHPHGICGAGARAVAFPWKASMP
eukprot:4733769-Heterocapsa_arctica.AAC.1